MKRSQILFFCLVFLCASFVFAQTHEKPAKTAHSKISAELGIKAAVYKDLLGNSSKDTAKFIGAYFLEAKNQERAYLQSLFANWQPRVEVGDTNNVIITKSNVVDRLSGKPATLFWARVRSQTNNEVQAVGGRYSTPEAGVEYHYQLTFNGTNWIVLNKKQGVIW
jgi:hypothetical protein